MDGNPGEVVTALTPRVAYFPDSFHEVNGVAHTSRQFEAFARQRNLPFLCVRAGSRSRALIEDGNVWTLELPRGFLSIPLERDLRFDPAFLRHLPLIRRVLERFQPDLIHITGPSEIGMIGAGVARRLGVPLVANWQTNLHQYAARRSRRLLRLLPERQSAGVGRKIENAALAVVARFYSRAEAILAPNPALCKMLQQATGRPCFLMPRGVDAALFNPGRCNRNPENRDWVLGYVGRLSVEKNVALLVQVQEKLERMGHRDFRFLVVGGGSEEGWLRERLHRVDFTGVLRGEALAEAYANMDLFVFPSHTETFGNVVLEALASGVPAIVTPDGGPAAFVHDGETGRIVGDAAFAAAIAAVMENAERRAAMRMAARDYALTASWDSVFEGVYAVYKGMLSEGKKTSSQDQEV